MNTLLNITENILNTAKHKNALTVKRLRLIAPI